MFVLGIPCKGNVESISNRTLVAAVYFESFARCNFHNEDIIACCYFCKQLHSRYVRSGLPLQSSTRLESSGQCLSKFCNHFFGNNCVCIFIQLNCFLAIICLLVFVIHNDVTKCNKPDLYKSS